MLVDWTLSRGHGASSVLSVKRQVQILTPVNNVSVGELIPVSVMDEAHSEEDSLSVPSYSEVSMDIANLELMWVFVP